MKKQLIIFTALLLLISCGRTAQPYVYVNDEKTCQLGETLYRDSWAVLNGALDTFGTLCHDPLCMHDFNDYGCPISNRFSGGRVEFQTDGEVLYMYNCDVDKLHEHFKETGIKANFRTIYSIDPSTDTMKEVVTFECSNYGKGTSFAVDGEYVYYKEGYIIDPEDNSASGQAVRIMRVKKTGSTPEDILGRELYPYDQFYVDSEYYYLTDDMEGTTEIISKETGASVQANLDGRKLRRIAVTESDTYAYAFDGEMSVTGENGEYTVYTYAVYAMDGGNFRCIAENVSDPVFSGGYIWYSTPELTYHGTTLVDTGAGIRSVKLDIASHTAKDIIRLDPATGETVRWTTEKHPELLGYSAGYVLSRLVDYAEYLETGVMDRTIYKLTLNDDGTAAIAGTIEKGS